MTLKISRYLPESKEQRGENSDFLFLGRTVRADIFGRLILGSQKSSQMAAYAWKSKNVESAVNINNLLSNKYPIIMLDLTKLLKLHFLLSFLKIWSSIPYIRE